MLSHGSLDQKCTQSARVLHAGSHKTETKVLAGCGPVWALRASSTFIQAMAGFSLLVAGLRSLFFGQLSAGEPQNSKRPFSIPTMWLLPASETTRENLSYMRSFSCFPSLTSSPSDLSTAHGARWGQVHCAAQHSSITGGDAILVTASVEGTALRICGPRLGAAQLIPPAPWLPTLHSLGPQPRVLLKAPRRPLLSSFPSSATSFQVLF